MGGSISGLLVAAAAFGLTFAAVRLVVSFVRKRKAAQARQQELLSRSRQVRRAQERRNKA